jgi:predicted MFS family arabinose efflux permease
MWRLPPLSSRSRNLYLLALCQALSLSCTLTVGLLGGIVGSRLAANPALATLPISCGILGTALGTVPAALLMRRIGRRRGFMLGALIAALSGVLAALALQLGSFALFCVATFGIGTNLAFAQQYRFAAAESVAPLMIPRAISLVLTGTLLGAFAAPALAALMADRVAGEQYVGSFLLVSAYALLALLLLSRLEDAPAGAASQDAPERGLGAIFKTPGFQLALVAAAVGYGIMSFIMTATPVSMHVVHGHGLTATAWVIQSHVLAMYLPSFVTGRLIARHGPAPVMLLGVAANLACIGLALAGHSVHDYWAALVLLGIGWNFLFVAGTSLLTRCYSASERFKAQAANDFAVFATSALGSFAAGFVLHRIGWHGVQIISLGAVLAIVLVLALNWRQAQRIAMHAPR